MVTAETEPIPAHITQALGLVVAEAGDSAVFSTAQARAHGLSRSALRVLVGRGLVRRVHRGWFARPDAVSDPRALHLRRTHAIIRNRDGRVVASHHSALVEHGVATFDVDLRTVHLTHRSNPTYRQGRNSITHGADISTSTEHCPAAQEAVTVPFAVVQTGLVHGPLATLVAADSALHQGLTTRADLAAVASMYRFAPSIPAVTAILAHTDARAESPTESLARHALTVLGYDPVPQLVIRHGGRSYRADLALVDHRVVLELDGAVKYAGPDAARTVMNEKTRQAALNRAGWHVVRLTWHELVAEDNTLRFDNITATLAPALRRAM